MDWKVFLLRVSIALLLGALIGAERQLRQRLTGLRTNALVSTGACLFVLMTQAVPGMAPNDASRVAAYVVSGIGFLGGGVIMRDGFNVRGLNTAATLWCAELLGNPQAPAQLERLVGRVSLEKGVSSVRWQLQTQALAAD
jgi:putative Mg2+ transporter-C (MgtC) family protein